MPHKKIQHYLGNPVLRELIRYLVLAAAVAILLIGALCGCTAPPSNQSSTHITILTTATSAEPRVVLPDSLVTAMTKMAKQSKRPGDATVRIASSATGDITTKDLTPTRPNGQVQHATADADRQITASVEELAKTVANVRADRPGLDLLGLLDRASQLPGELHIVSSGISTVAPVDLRVIGWNADPDSVIESIARQGRLPSLPGRHVTFHGLGIPAGLQPGLPPFARPLVEQLWTGICQRAGAASCTVAQDAPSAAAPVATMPVPIVPVPDAITDSGSGCPVWASLNDTTLHFAPDSPVLPANADDALRPIVQAAARCDISSIDVTGHIADTGIGDTRNNLSERRARAVADRLVVLGLPSELLGIVSGRDAHEPIIPNFTDGVFDEAKAQQNRRVELTFHRRGL
ncbi:OmpA family protein [Nocardia farcinica]|uniref:OmpA family protein n=1 Tax=Nocardia farcinica TaxID=37329 RepID=UPI0018952D78|nr:OmpA family protein [Nocardia farcinica]MBF6185049.1 OmpA family protein [Nocardia farcinica]MBF6363983.1 OmpA family protein [Nocardia farcinica]